MKRTVAAIFAKLAVHLVLLQRTLFVKHFFSTRNSVLLVNIGLIKIALYLPTAAQPGRNACIVGGQ